MIVGCVGVGDDFYVVDAVAGLMDDDVAIDAFAFFVVIGVVGIVVI